MAETEWTISTLKELFDRTTSDRDIRVNLALSAAKEAVTKAELSDEKRFALLNEFRGQSADEARKYATRESVDQIVGALDRRVGVNESALAMLQGRALALAAFGTLFGGIVGALVAKMIG